MSSRRSARFNRRIEISENSDPGHDTPERSPLLRTDTQNELNQFFETPENLLPDQKKLQVILFYRDNSVLWTTHGRAEIRKKSLLLKEFGQRISMRPNDIQKMFRSLRVQFHTNKRNGNTNWKFFNELSFLANEPNVQSIELTTTQEEDTQNSVTFSENEHTSSTVEGCSNQYPATETNESPRIVAESSPGTTSSQSIGNEQSGGFSQRGREESTETSQNEFVSLEQFVLRRQNQRVEIADLLKEIKETLKGSSGPVFGGLTFGISLLKGCGISLLKDCDYTAEQYKSNTNYF